MGSSAVPAASGYFFGDDRSAVLGVDRWSETKSAPQPSPAHLVYDLYPPSVEEFFKDEWICFGKGELRRSGLPLRTNGDQVGARWVMGSGVNLSGPLTRALRKVSVFQGHPEAWSAMLESLTPNSLEAAGYRRCSVLGVPSQNKDCYCVH